MSSSGRPDNKVVIDRQVRSPFVAFEDRADAGRALCEFMGALPDPKGIVVAVPRGGVPAGEPLADAVEASMKVAWIRKLPIPWSPEAGFGAVASDGTTILNEPMVKRLGLERQTIERVAEEVRAELERRKDKFGPYGTPPSLEGKNVYVVDDGLATGFTMIAVAKVLRGKNPEGLSLAVPVSPEGSIRRVREYFDRVHCLIAQRSPPFAVASYYRAFPELPDAQIQDILGRLDRYRAEGEAGK